MVYIYIYHIDISSYSDYIDIYGVCIYIYIYESYIYVVPWLFRGLFDVCFRVEIGTGKIQQPLFVRNCLG